MCKRIKTGNSILTSVGGGCNSTTNLKNKTMAKKINKPISYVGLPNNPQRKQINGPLVKIIEYALTSLHLQRPKHSYGVSYRYLLNQCIRQYLVPDSNIYISVGAGQVWQNMGLNLGDIYKYTYQDVIVPQNNIQVGTCVGTKKSVITKNIIAGQPIAYNSVFIDEHTTPVKDVTEALKQAYISNPCTFTIIGVLDKMHITKMLKCENAKIAKNTNRISAGDYISKSSSQIFNDIISDPSIGYPTI